MFVNCFCSGEDSDLWSPLLKSCTPGSTSGSHTLEQSFFSLQNWPIWIHKPWAWPFLVLSCGTKLQQYITHCILKHKKIGAEWGVSTITLDSSIFYLNKWLFRKTSSLGSWNVFSCCNSWSIPSAAEPTISSVDTQNSLSLKIKLVLCCSMNDIEKS